MKATVKVIVSEEVEGTTTYLHVQHRMDVNVKTGPVFTIESENVNIASGEYIDERKKKEANHKYLKK